MDQSEIQKAIIKCLIEEKETSLFLQKAFRILIEARPKVSFASLSRKMGFSSRSYVRQLFVGTRRANLKNYRQIAFALGLSSEATEYFGMMVEREQRAPRSQSPQVLRRLDESEKRLRANLSKKIQRASKKDPAPFEKWPFVYAALGESGKGRTLNEIIEISGEDLKTCSEILGFFLNNGIVLWNEQSQTYVPKAEIIEVEELAQSSILKNLYKTITTESLHRIDFELGSESSLFHSSVFSVNEKFLPQLTKDLQNLLFAYATKSEDSNGQTLALLSSCLIPLKRKQIRK